MRKFIAAQKEAQDRGDQLVGVADRIARETEEVVIGRLLLDLQKRGLLMQVVDLERLSRDEQRLSEAVRAYQLFPAAMLDWLRVTFGLETDRAVDDILEVSADRLAKFDLVDPEFSPVGELVRIRVLAPGWKRHGRLLFQPKVTIVT